jgi:hypothetical protein
MKEKQVALICMGLLTVALLATSGCSGGGGGDSSAASPSTSTALPTASTYSIRGSVIGLVGTGLVLQNNGADDLVINQNQNFKFPTSVEAGNTCNVTILTQPTSPVQTCEVVNGARMVSGGDINDILVKCQAIPTYRISGTTAGLLGTGLVLQNNGTDDLVVNPNEDFRFLGRVEDGSNCNVTILAQPTSPAQTCEVANGSRMVAGSDITDVRVLCRTTVVETFDDSGGLNLAYWDMSGAYDRKLVGGQLQFKLASTGGFSFDALRFRDPGCGEVAAEITTSEPVFIGTGDKAFRTRLQGCGYHATADGEAAGTRTGDVNAAIIFNGSQASFQVFRCLNDDCNAADSVAYLTPGAGGDVPLGTVQPNMSATLSIDWNSILAPGPEQFSFRLNNDPPIYFDPVAAGAAIAAAVPNMPEKHLGVQITLANPDNDQAEMTVNVDNVKDGLLTDNFEGGNYLDGSFWKKTSGRRQIENGRLVLESGQDFVDDPGADNRFNNTTDLRSHNGIILNGPVVVEADITLDPAAFVVDSGGNPAEVYALLEMEFRPPDVNKKDYTNFFAIRAALKESPLGVSAGVLAAGCKDYSCTARYTLANDNQSFVAPVVKGQAYHLKIEYRGNGLFEITLEGAETLSVDLAGITGFASAEFSAVRLSTASQGTDTFGEEAFIRAYFDNVRAGGP